MPNRIVHSSVGVIAGVVPVCLVGQSLTARENIVIATGGVFGGLLGSILPDIIDLPRSFNHRSIGHSMCANGTWLFLILSRCQEACIDRVQFSKDAAEEGDTLKELFWLFLAGFILGFALGYLSHLLLDMTTPMGLPW
jgi:membrane-bound metal-dependent hydrolase YbcI (DUF457 family)